MLGTEATLAVAHVTHALRVGLVTAEDEAGADGRHAAATGRGVGGAGGRGAGTGGCATHLDSPMETAEDSEVVAADDVLEISAAPVRGKPGPKGRKNQVGKKAGSGRKGAIIASSLVPDCTVDESLLPPDPPPDSLAHTRVYLKDRPEVPHPFAIFTYCRKDPTGYQKISIQATVAATGSRYASVRILRACWAMLEEGATKQEIVEFRNQCYARLNPSGKRHEDEKQLKSGAKVVCSGGKKAVGFGYGATIAEAAGAEVHRATSRAPLFRTPRPAVAKAAAASRGVGARCQRMTRAYTRRQDAASGVVEEAEVDIEDCVSGTAEDVEAEGEDDASGDEEGEEEGIAGCVTIFDGSQGCDDCQPVEASHGGEGSVIVLSSQSRRPSALPVPATKDEDTLALTSITAAPTSPAVALSSITAATDSTTAAAASASPAVALDSPGATRASRAAAPTSSAAAIPAPATAASPAAAAATGPGCD
mmetsp:Transcript_103857/g.322938  ORF Transcript_103857/g.322938 Transcript_103857/m.322938 type:complete len:478 (-) Transcript_103857:153-1586(-)